MRNWVPHEGIYLNHKPDFKLPHQWDMAKSFWNEIFKLPTWINETIGTCRTIGTVACDYLVPDVLDVPCVPEIYQNQAS